MISNWHTIKNRLLAKKNNSIASSYYVLEKVTRSPHLSSLHWARSLCLFIGGKRLWSFMDQPAVLLSLRSPIWVIPRWLTGVPQISWSCHGFSMQLSPQLLPVWCLWHRLNRYGLISMIFIPEEMKLRYSSLNKKFQILVSGIWLLLSTILNLRPYGQRSSYINQFLPIVPMSKENRGYAKVHVSFFT